MYCLKIGRPEDDRERTMQLDEKNARVKKTPSQQDWNFSLAVSEGYVIVQDSDDE